MMAVITMVTGAALAAIGWVVFDATGREHYTALIPTFLGLALIVLGGLSFKDSLRKHTMHVAAALGALGFLAFTARGVASWVVLAGWVNGTVNSEPAAYGLLYSALVCLLFVGLCVNSFIQARRRRRQAEAAEAAAAKPAS
jgi:hypothetical protein